MNVLLRSGFFWVLVAETAFAVMRIATRAGASDLPWAELGAARFLGGALVAIASARARGVTLRVGDQKHAWLRSGFGTLNALCVFYALGSQRIAVGDATTLSATTPLFVALLSWPVLRERVTPLVWLGVALGFAGVAVLVKPGFAAMGGVAALAVTGAFFFSFALLSLRRMGPHESSEAIALHVSLVAGLTLLAVAAPNLAMPHRGSWLPLLLAALMGGLAQVAMGRAYGLQTAARLSAFSYVGVVLTYALEAAFFHRAPAVHQYAGAAMVIAAGALVSLRIGPPRRAESGAG